MVGVSLGACVVEKHVCLSRAIKSPDSEFSMEMPEFAQMVRDIRAAEQIRGQIKYGPLPGEGNVIFRRSLFAVRDIKKGEAFTTENMRSIRPGQGLAPKYYSEILGRRAEKDIRRGEPVTKDMAGL